MPYVAGRNVPSSYTSVIRGTNQARVRVVVNPNPSLSDDLTQRYTYGYQEITVGQSMRTRRMAQKSNPDVFYEFTFPPTQIAYEGMGVEISEIPRPLQRPLIDVRAARNYKAVFEFLVAEQFDGLTRSVESQLQILEWMANTAEPVYFENFDSFLCRGFWYIGEFSIKTSRVNTEGEIVAAQCSIGLLEYEETTTKFAKFPRISYAKTTSRKKGGSSTSGQAEPNTATSTFDQESETATTGEANTIKQTIVYRWERTEAPSSLDLKKSAWQKVDGKWYLYSTNARFPYAAIEEVGSSTRLILENLKSAQKTAYLFSVALLRSKGVSVPAATITEVPNSGAQ